MTDETRARFLAAIAAQIPSDRVIEVHLFGAIKQGGIESGIAVIAVDPDAPVAADDRILVVPALGEAEGSEADDPLLVDDEQVLRSAQDDTPSAPAAPARRFIVYTARYRLTLKGLDRGKWEVSVKEEADAPLVTVDAVVRGVSRRSGDADETVRLSGDEFRAQLPEVAARR
jgi:hypothetical protein